MIKDILDGLSVPERAQLMYAFECDIAHRINLPDKKFLGVNLVQSKDTKVLEQTGKWSYGEVT